MDGGLHSKRKMDQISENLRREGGRTHWDLILYKNLNDWEVEEYMVLMEGIHKAIVFFEEEDRIRWEWDSRDETQ